MDAQRAVSLVRSKASDWGVDPKRIGVLGFSAGGHLGAWVSTNADKRAYEPVDDTDKASIRPDFAVLIYPGGVIKRGTDQLAPEIRVTSETPPTFLVHATNDSSENSALLYLALKRAGRPRRASHLLHRRPRLRHASRHPALRRLAQTLRGVAQDPGHPQGRLGR